MQPISRRVFLSGAAAVPSFAARRLVVRDPAELAAAAKRAQPGDVLVLRNGTWSDADLAFEAHGTEGAPVTVRAGSPGKVILTGNSRLRFSGEWTVVEGLFFRGCRGTKDLIEFRTAPGRFAAHSRLSHCAVSDCSPEDKLANTRLVNLYGTANEVSHCYIAGKTNTGASMVVWLGETPNQHRIVRNWWGPRPRLGHNGGESLRVGDSNTSMRDSLTLVEGNLFEHCDGEIEVISNKSCGNVYRGNLFDACAGTLTLRHGNRCRVERNIFLGHGVKNSGGVRIIGEEHVVDSNYFEGLRGTGFSAAVAVVNGLPDSPPSGYFQVRNPVIRNNIMVDCTEGLKIGVNGGNVKLVLSPEGVVAENNTTLQHSAAPQFDRASAGPSWWPRAASSRYTGSRMKAALLALFTAALLLAQQPPAKQQEPPEPPEEDLSLSEQKVYVLNPLQSAKELKIGLFYMKKGSYKAAARRFEEATKWDPNSAEAFLRLGEAQDKLGDRKAAHAAWEQYLKLQPDSKHASEIRKKLGKKSQ